MCRLARSISETCTSLFFGPAGHSSRPSDPPAVQLCVDRMKTINKRRSGKLVQKHFSPRCERENILSSAAAAVNVFFVSLKICNVNWAIGCSARAFCPLLPNLSSFFFNWSFKRPTMIRRRGDKFVGDHIDMFSSSLTTIHTNLIDRCPSSQVGHRILMRQ